MSMSKLERDMISAAFRSIIEGVVTEHYEAKTQEHQLSARIGQELESVLGRMSVFSSKISVITQDIPDKGRGAMESKTGIDLYVSVTLRDRNGFSKAFLVQSKWDWSSDRYGMISQCQKMLAVSPDAYVWTYQSDGVVVTPAQDILTRAPTSIKSASGMRLDDMMGELLVCKVGDPTLAVPDISDRSARRRVLTEIIEDIDAKSGIDLEIVRNSLGTAPSRVPDRSR